jgi:hypothetical protein
MRPEISATLQFDLIMIVGAITALLFLGWIANRIVWAYRNYRAVYGQHAGQQQHYPGGHP